MFVLTPLMVTKYDLPPELMEYTTKGNMSIPSTVGGPVRCSSTSKLKLRSVA